MNDSKTSIGRRRSLAATGKAPRARWVWYALAALAVLVVGRVEGQTVQTGPYPVTRAVKQEFAKVGDFVVGPHYHDYTASPALSCVEIYYHVARLTPYTYNYKPNFYDDPRNGAIGALGFVFPPAFYAWGYTALDRYSEQRGIADAGLQIDALRRVSAQQDCWVKH